MEPFHGARATAPTAPLPTTPTPGLTFYRRPLPATAVSFSSRAGRDVFASALATGGAHAFFPLIEQLQTQSEPAYCGLTTLVIVLNALAVDPRQSWKGPWRWYEESMLNCCVDLEKAKTTGISFRTFACLARCQGLRVEAVHGANSTVDEFRRVVRRTCTAPPSPADDALPTSFLVASYTRAALGQTGTGHFSPVGAYDAASDRVLLLDTARFKYGPHWIPLPLLFDAMLPLVPDTGLSRGYVVLSYDGRGGADEGRRDPRAVPHLPMSVLFASKRSNDAVRGEYRRYLLGMEEEGAGPGVTLAAVVAFWTENATNNHRVWELLEPRLQPVVHEELRMVGSLRGLVRDLLAADDLAVPPVLRSRAVGECCRGWTPGHGPRVLDVSPAEALCVIYLASLPPEARREVVWRERPGAAGADDATREQLLAEAALISYAIETAEVDT